MAIENAELDDAIASKNIEGVVTVLLKQKPSTLALLKVDGKPEVNKTLSSPALKPFWEGMFNQYRLENGFQFRDPTPQSKADFYCGYILYRESLKEKKSNYRDYVTKLAIEQCNSFYAHREFLKNLILECNDLCEDEAYGVDVESRNSSVVHDNEEKYVPQAKKNVATLLTYLSSKKASLELFKTPGCLLLANTYFYAAGFFQTLKEPDEAARCYKDCWVYLHCAALLEEYSVRDIHNAYYGQGYTFSNAFKVSSINEMKEGCLAQAKLVLSDKVLASLEKTALSICKNIMNALNIKPAVELGIRSAEHAEEAASSCANNSSSSSYSSSIPRTP